MPEFAAAGISAGPFEGPNRSKAYVSLLGHCGAVERATMSDEFNITSELFSIKVHRQRRDNFVAFLKKRFCTENFEVWTRTVDLIDLIRNHSLDVVRLRNAALFDLYNNFVHEGSETAMNVTMELQHRLQKMASDLRVDANGRFDVRLILELQKEAEVLLLTDVKQFVADNPFEDSNEEPVGDMALDGVILVSYRQREKLAADRVVPPTGNVPAGAAGGQAGSLSAHPSAVGEASPKGSWKNKSRVRTTTGIKSMFSSSHKEPAPVKHRVTLDSHGALNIYAPSSGSSVTSSILFELHLSAVSLNTSHKKVGAAASAPPASSAKKEKDKSAPDFSFAFSCQGKDFTFRFKSDEESRQWHKAFMQQYEHWRKIRQQRKERRAWILQAVVETEADGGSNMVVDSFQGALRRKPSENGTIRNDSGAATAGSSTSKAGPVSSKGKQNPAANTGLSVSTSSVPPIMGGSKRLSQNRRASTPVGAETASGTGKQRGDLTSSAPPVTTFVESQKKSALEEEEDDSSSSEGDRFLAMSGNAVYRAITFDDGGPGLADASMYDVPENVDPSSPLGELYGALPGSAYSDAVQSAPVAVGEAQLLNSYTVKSQYDLLNKAATPVVPANGGISAMKRVAASIAASGMSDGRTSRAVEELSDSSDEQENDGQFVHQDNLYDFNGMFQQKLQELMDLRRGGILNPGQLEGVYTSIIRLGEDFVKTALTYGKIIINEKYLPLRHKTIKPSADMGGVLGGEKYVVHNMLFKFAIDSRGVFRGRDDASAKVAGHELKGLKAYFSVADPELHFPLMALIDYKGFRLIAVSMLPLKSGSLIYGSEDAGATVHAKDPKLNELIENASKRLNLKPHRCGKSDVTVYSPVDLEGHAGTDGRYYLLDFSRVFPPVTPSKEVVGGHLFQYFRSEFVYNWPLFPLCSDAYSRFVQGYDEESRRAEKEHMQEVDAATKDLTGITLSNFARELVAMLEEEVRAVGTLKDFRLTEEMHRLGINMRYLGLLVSRLGRFKYAKFLVTHMCARLVKGQIRQRLRAKMAELKLAVDEPYRICVTDYLNLVFGDSKESTDHWNTEIVEGLDQRFSLRPRNWNQFPKNLKEYVWSGLEMRKGQMLDLRVYLFEQVRTMTGITFSDTLESLITGANNDFWQQERWCDDTDVEDLGAKVKHLDVMSKARGRVFTLRGEEKQRQGYLKSAKQLFMSATESFETALSGSPLDPDLLRNCAITMLRVILIDQRLDEGDSSKSETSAAEGRIPKLSLDNPAAGRVDRYFVRALQANPEDPFSHLSYAKFMVLCGEHEKAEDHFLEALYLEPNTEKGLLAYAEFLQNVRGQSIEAAMFRSRAQQVRLFLLARDRRSQIMRRPDLNQTLIIPKDSSSPYSPAE